ncbi:MAG: 16S rRNA (cytosine967-C5)-methyltransferase, partial [Phenylobacterium sp.]
MNPQTSNIRAQAALCLFQVVDKGRSLSDALPQAQGMLANPKDKALLQQLCYGTLRWLPRLDFFCSRLLKKPLKGKQRPFTFLLYVGIFQLTSMRIPAHAAISETVEAAQALKAPGLKAMINGVLRNFQRQQADLDQQADEIEVCRYGHPNWFIKQVKQAYPEQWQQILLANQQQAPMWLRVNQRQFSLSDYTAQLNDAEIAAHAFEELGYDGLEHGICLASPTDVFKLPGFAEGSCSVQDGAAQFAAQILDVQPGDKVLDACAAPGGKTCHMLERQPELTSMLAIDSDENRLLRVQENLDRLQLNAKTSLKTADAADADSFWDGQLFDRILLDAPCSATGVIRRHPDIKWLRRQQDIAQLATLQQSILKQMWAILKPGGTLVYATCSVLPEENQAQISAFLAETDNARLEPINDNDTIEMP